MVQWLRIHLPMQGARVRSLVQEDPTCRGAAKPLCRNCWAHALEPHALQQEKPPQWEAHTLQLERSPCSLQLEKTHAQRRWPGTAKNKKLKSEICSPLFIRVWCRWEEGEFPFHSVFTHPHPCPWPGPLTLLDARTGERRGQGSSSGQGLL